MLMKFLQQALCICHAAIIEGRE